MDNAHKDFASHSGPLIYHYLSLGIMWLSSLLSLGPGRGVNVILGPEIIPSERLSPDPYPPRQCHLPDF